MRLLSKAREKNQSVKLRKFILPEMTLLNHQLINFQAKNKTMEFVVDKCYGDIKVLSLLRDILEEMMDEFSTGVDDSLCLVHKKNDDSYLINS